MSIKPLSKAQRKKIHAVIAEQLCEMAFTQNLVKPITVIYQLIGSLGLKLQPASFVASEENARDLLYADLANLMASRNHYNDIYSLSNMSHVCQILLKEK